MKFIDQYTPVTVAVSSKQPAYEQAFVVLVSSTDGKPNSIDSGTLPKPVRAALTAVEKAGALPSKANEQVCQVCEDGTRLIIISVGESARLTLQGYREAGAAAAKAARKLRIDDLSLQIDPSWPLGSHEIAAACANGLCNGFFLLEQFKGKPKTPAKAMVLRATLVVDKAADRFAKVSVDRAVLVAKSQNYVRAIAGHPGNYVHPPELARIASDVAKSCGLKLRVLDEKEMKRLRMGGMLGVGMGSPQTPPRMIVLEWPGKSSKAKANKPLLLIGKAITFDTGGISIKPREGMQRMVFDKCGAMAVLGTMIALARTQSSQRVIGILAAAENHVSATAYRPGDILTMYNGVTVEITNTDAEGRLVLGDALAWGIETYKPAAVVNLATLTGGVVIALGKEFAGLFSNHDGLATEIAFAGSHEGEKTWRLPIGEEVREMMKSDHADIVNSAGRHAHAIQGAEFLRRFVPDDGSTPWVHLDIAGVADNEKPSPLYTSGATGWGVRTLVDWVASRARSSGQDD